MIRTSVTVASLNIRGVPLTGSHLTARCQAIGDFFEASDADVVCFQEVHTYYHLRQLSRQMLSFRYASFRRTLPGPAGDVVTFSRRPMSATAYHGFGPPPHAPGIPSLTRIRARMKGALVTGWPTPQYLWSTLIRWPIPTATGRRRTGSARFIVPSSLLWPVSCAAFRSRLWCGGGCPPLSGRNEWRQGLRRLVFLRRARRRAIPVSVAGDSGLRPVEIRAISR